MKGLGDVSGWREAVKRALAEEGACVLVSLARARGSTPREAGAKMVVWADGFAGSIGGGTTPGKDRISGTLAVAS